MAVMEKRRLGKGLEALLGSSIEARETAGVASVAQVPVDQIVTNPHQPRKDFDDEELAALKQSLATHGLLQPVVVRPTSTGYQLIAGERRLRAARAVGWKQIPVRVVDFNDQQTFEAALVENLQRADLNPIEKALGFRDYLAQYHLTQEELAQRVGLDRTTISNLLRLLELPPEVQDVVRAGQVSNGHARALLALDDREQQKAICQAIVAQGLSVRAVEQLVKQQRPERSRGDREPSPPEKTAHVQAIEDELRQKLAVKVEIRVHGSEKGQVILPFDCNDDFDRLLETLRG